MSTEMNNLDYADKSWLSTPAVAERAETIMTGFGLWLLDNGFPLAADNYSDPATVAARLRRTNISYFATGPDSDDPTRQTIIAYPVSHFEDILSSKPDSASQDELERYARHETALAKALGKLADLSVNKAKKVSDPSLLRTLAVNVLNDYAIHDDGDKEVVNGKHFSSSSTETFAKRTPAYWLGCLLVADDQARFPLTDEASRSERFFKGKKTAIADEFMEYVLKGSNDYEGLVEATLGISGYMAISQLLYGGDMQKAFVNISAVAKMTGQSMPDGWQQFHGSTAELQVIPDQLASVKPQLAGYIEIADSQFGGDMLKAFENISAVAKMTGQPMPEGWQAFHGSTAEFQVISNQLASVKPKLFGYLELADAQFGGNMLKAFQNISAVAKMTGQSMPDGWQQFQGSTEEFRDQLAWIGRQATGAKVVLVDAYRREFYPNRKIDPKKKFDRVVINLAVIQRAQRLLKAA